MIPGLSSMKTIRDNRPRKTGVTVLFAGQYWPGANTLYIARAFEDCGAVVRILNETAIYPAEWWSLGGRLIRKALLPLIVHEWNSQLLGLAQQLKPDLIYLSNSEFVRPRTLKALRALGIPMICFYHDATWNRPGDHFLENVPFFDLISTTRAWHGPLVQKAGGRAVKIVRFGYDPFVHKPILPDPQAIARYGADVTFIGTMEPARKKALEELVSHDFSYKFRLWGGYWSRLPAASPLRPFWQGRAVHEQEIPVIYATSKIALHWVSREPDSDDEMLRIGDEHNSRSFQIPACGGALMLAQRTAEHLRLFKEEQEAIYFDDRAELREKIRYWLDPAREQARRSIVEAARERCIREDYSYVPVVREYLAHFGLPCVVHQVRA